MNMEVLSLLPGLLVLCTIGSLFFPKPMAFWSKKESPSRLGTAIIYLFIFFIASTYVYRDNIIHQDDIAKEDIKNDAIENNSYIYEIQQLKSNKLNKFGKYTIEVFKNDPKRMLINIRYDRKISIKDAMESSEEFARITARLIAKKDGEINKYISVFPGYMTQGETGKSILITYKGYAEYSPYSDSISWINEQ
ncbi:hypothetical protein HMPREF0179_05131 [Bilophila wadsworthia 3_1_6]|uniref:Uncharacterized protein n=1 Tax=Bilophila wadsworthia (strain 3_1_6) TaxID=563192 RepID=S2LBH4_BILW3|nr:hypothetical protein [Bilophila wadsworthia]EPC05847.1 hypothetical protein HMPREF0179_05131 [Bilophila wadsworthia 3_1_6]MBS6358376.1 hypothetical protein [Akkermansia muciniphila]